jgi:SAM-dependent methyltransferase
VPAKLIRGSAFSRRMPRALPFEDNSFDRAFSMLVLQFIPDTARAVGEMCRVVRPGGTVTAAVWDVYGGTPHTRLIWDIAGVLNPSIDRPLIRPLSAPNELAKLWAELGFRDAEQTSLLIRADFSCFDDHWLPFTKGEASEEASPDVLLENSNLVAHGTLGQSELIGGAWEYLPLMKRVRN